MATVWSGFGENKKSYIKIGLRESIIIGVLTLFAITLIYSPSINNHGLAKPNTKSAISCTYIHNPGQAATKVYCSQSEYNGDGEEIHEYCTLCDNTQPPSNCSPRSDTYVGPCRNYREGGVIDPGKGPPKNKDSNIPPRGGGFVEPGKSLTLDKNTKGPVGNALQGLPATAGN